MISNPSPLKINSWSVEGGIRSFVVSIPTIPPDNDLAGIIIVAKSGVGQSPTFPDDVFYRGPWSDLIVIDTDANNNALLPNQAYTIKVAAFDGFGTSSLNVSDALEVVTLQLVEDDIADEAVTNDKIPDDEIQSAKISGLIADKITAGTITGSTIQTSSSGKRFVVSSADEAVFYDQDFNSELTQLASIGTYGSRVIYTWPNNSTGDTDAIYTGGAQVKTSPSSGVYGVEFVSSGTVKVYVPDLVPGNSYEISVVTNSGSGQTINMGGANVNIGTVGTYTVACERAYFLISNTGTITTPEFVYISSISRISGGAFSEAIIVSGSKNEDKVSFIGTSLNSSAIKAYSYGSTTVGTIDSRNNGTGSGYSVFGQTVRGSSNGLAWGLYGFSSISTYTGADLLTASVGVYGRADNGGAGVLGTSSRPFDDDNLQNDCAAFKSLNGDCDFRNSVVYFKTFTVSTLPSASIAGGMIYVSNESGGAVMAFSDGTNWRRVTDRAIVS
jgi:hypothetical protein